VHVQFRDAAGNVSSVFTDAICHDSEAPTGTILLTGHEVKEDRVRVVLQLGTADRGCGKPADMRFSVDAVNWTNWEKFKENKVWDTPPERVQAGSVYVQYRDAAGNLSRPLVAFRQ
jgi:hypothetical protein